MRLLFVFVFLSSVAFGQSKKKQIESLNKSLDSLNYVLEIERKLYQDQIDKANQNLQEANKKSTDKITTLNLNIYELQHKLNLTTEKSKKSDSENKKLKKEINKLTNELQRINNQKTLGQPYCEDLIEFKEISLSNINEWAPKNLWECEKKYWLSNKISKRNKIKYCKNDKVIFSFSFEDKKLKEDYYEKDEVCTERSVDFKMWSENGTLISEAIFKVTNESGKGICADGLWKRWSLDGNLIYVSNDGYYDIESLINKKWVTEELKDSQLDINNLGWNLGGDDCEALIEINFLNGKNHFKLDSHSVYSWYKTGQLHTVYSSTYGGKRYGIELYPNGIIKAIGSNAGINDWWHTGTNMGWYINGQLKYSYVYEENCCGQPHSKLEYYENGQLKREFKSYDDDGYPKIKKCYDQVGNLIECICKDSFGNLIECN